MPLFLKLNTEQEGVAGIWQTEEDDSYFLDRLQLYPEELEELKTLRSRKKTEWLSSRYLLHLLSERHIRGACLKDAYGKPYLQDSDYHISISHSGKFTAVIASPHIVGIDIQIIVAKIERIANKFVTDTEFNSVHNQYHIESLHAIWGAKEAMYKAYGKKALDFKKHLKVTILCH